MKPLKTVSLALALAAPLAAAYAQGESPRAQPESGPAVREFSVVNLEYQGTKVWVPATLIVKKGEKVRITLTNNAPSGTHGYSIEAFGVMTEVAKEKKTVEFVADKAGLFRIHCQIHPAHIGGQLLVLE